MSRKHVRHPGEGYNIQIIEINGDKDEELASQSIDVDDISKGGLRFTTKLNFDLEDRVRLNLRFPDDSVKEVLGRICYNQHDYSSDNPDDNHSYGFSILEGFYDLVVS